MERDFLAEMFGTYYLDHEDDSGVDQSDAQIKSLTDDSVEVVQINGIIGRVVAHEKACPTPCEFARSILQRATEDDPDLETVEVLRALIHAEDCGSKECHNLYIQAAVHQ